jgi:hypothetical protein
VECRYLKVTCQTSILAGHTLNIEQVFKDELAEWLRLVHDDLGPEFDPRNGTLLLYFPFCSSPIIDCVVLQSLIMRTCMPTRVWSSLICTAMAVNGIYPNL